MGQLRVAAFFVLALQLCWLSAPAFAKEGREGKLLSMFEIVRFKNDACNGTSNRIGTCYTSKECEERGGTASTSCAEGFGVCCVFTQSCGSRSSENCTYMAETDYSTQGSCSYKICRCSSDVCRVRLDFVTNEISGPESFTVATGTNGDLVGRCLTDTFSVSSAGNDASPIICGVNNGQHMIMDVGSDGCINVDLTIGGTTSVNRNWNIKATQYECGSARAGPSDCLQYFTGESGTISSYNFPTTDMTFDFSTTHLANQCYTICVRRESGMCGICYVPRVTSMTEASYGLTSATFTQELETNCILDYVVIPGAVDAVVGATPMPLDVTVVPSPAIHRICGSLFSVMPASMVAIAYDPAGMMHVSVCSTTVPFQIAFKTDGGEDNAEAAAAAEGNLGFSLNYRQITC